MNGKTEGADTDGQNPRMARPVTIGGRLRYQACGPQVAKPKSCEKNAAGIRRRRSTTAACNTQSTGSQAGAWQLPCII